MNNYQNILNMNGNAGSNPNSQNAYANQYNQNYPVDENALSQNQDDGGEIDSKDDDGIIYFNFRK